MGKLWLCAVLGVLGASAVVHAEDAAPAESPPPAVSAEAVPARHDTVTVNTGLGPMAGPEAGLVWRHRLNGPVDFTLGFYAASNQVLSSGLSGSDPLLVAMTPASTTTLTLEPGLRLRLGESGLFAGANLPFGWSRYSVSGATGNALVGGLDLLAGFAHVFEGGLAVEVYAGPAARVWKQQLSISSGSAESTSAVLALRAGVGVGYAF